MTITETKKIRKSMGLSQKEFAEKLGFAKTTICNWETGLFSPSPSAIKQLIKFCEKNKIRIEM